MTEETTPKVRVSEHVLRSCNKLVREAPGIRSDAISKELSLGQTTISRAGIYLEKQGLVTRVRNGKFFHYYPAGDPTRRVRPTTATDVEIEALKAEIAELTAFRERAVAFYPNLSVEPIIHQAREIAQSILFEMGDRDAADTVMAGEADGSPIMKSTLAALRAATAYKGD